MPKLSREIHCDLCVETFERFTDLYEHMKQGHKSHEDKKSRDNSLPVLQPEELSKNSQGPMRRTVSDQCCSFRVTNARGLRNTLLPRVIPILSRITKRFNVSKSKSSVKQSIYPCLYCTKTFLSRANLRQHRTTNCASDSQGTNSYTCSICDKRYKKYMGYILHMALHNVKQAVKSGNDVNLHKGLKCVRCKQSGFSKQTYLSHFKTSCVGKKHHHELSVSHRKYSLRSKLKKGTCHHCCADIILYIYVYFPSYYAVTGLFYNFVCRVEWHCSSRVSWWCGQW